ncbi:hypothetical protein P4A93_26550, partial [Pseudomonas syringae pv. syringae]|uniref:hypothetical protein n=1 Tax=Pseudomonas syringae TaxID=317 RepID=UPI0023F98B7C
TDKAATVNEVPKNHLTVVNRFFDEAKLSVTFLEKSTFTTESARSSQSADRLGKPLSSRSGRQMVANEKPRNLIFILHS